MIRALFAGLTLLLIAACAQATCYVRSRVIYPVYPVVKEVVKEVVAIKEVPVAVYVPVATYTAVYQPSYAAPAGPPAPAPVNGASEIRRSDVQAILDGLKLLDQRTLDTDRRLKILEGRFAPGVTPGPEPGPGPAPKPPVTPPGTKPVDPFVPKAPVKAHATAAQIVQGNCASCHDVKVAKEKGKGMELIKDGVLTVWTDRTARKLQSKITRNEMPPPDAIKRGTHRLLTDEEFSTIMAHIDTLK